MRNLLFYSSANKLFYTGMPRFLQGNLNRSAISHNLVMEVAKKKNVDFMVVSEPNMRKIGRMAGGRR